jgi:hypothetical protein
MRKSQKFFRYIWRINAVLILLAAGAVTLGVGGLLVQEFGFKAARSREAEAGIAIAGANVKSDLILSRASVVPGTQVMRAELQRSVGEVKFSSGSGYGSEVRNILFIEPGQKTAHWLLPDNDHIVSDSSDITEQKDPNKRRVLVTAVLVKSVTSSPESTIGRLLLFDPPGTKIVEVADHDRTIQVASMEGDELNILYERDKHLFLIVFNPHSLGKLREQEIEVPQLK